MSDCLFCKIAAKNIPSKVIYEDEMLIAIEDINPSAPVHVLLIPKKHIASLNDIGDTDKSLLGHIQVIAAQIAKEQKIAKDGYRLVNNCGTMGGQEVMHLHYHLLGGREMLWPPG
ncbi:MAG: histidine triad nucleotide-binding protein [Syntrophomonadaceae bacterium]|jgi:histidine triad (HIT) family protein|nr:histidine triad nucleotide-binding protein [Syntrophomonadaceae bacterium]